MYVCASWFVGVCVGLFIFTKVYSFNIYTDYTYNNYTINNYK